MICSPRYLRATFVAWIVLVALAATQRPALAQPTTDTSPASAKAESDTEVESADTQDWTCPMHAQIRQSKSGKCPICGMELTAVTAKEPKLVSLQEMLEIALKHNPDVRAAEAKVRSVEAELDRTRLEVVQKLIAFREKWHAQQFALQAAEREAAEAVKYEKLVKEGAVGGKNLALFAAAKEKLAFHREKLAEVEAELPFLLGQTPEKAESKPGDASRKLIREELLPKAHRLLELRILEYQTGKSGVLEVAAANRQVAELEVRTAETNKRRVAALESQKRSLEEFRAITQQRYQAGEAGQADVLVIDLELSKLDLQLLELKGK